MDISSIIGSISNNLLAVVGGAVVVAAAAFLIFKPGPKKKAKPENNSKKAAAEAGSTRKGNKKNPKTRTAETAAAEPDWKKRMSILQKIRSIRKLDIMNEGWSGKKKQGKQKGADQTGDTENPTTLPDGFEPMSEQEAIISGSFAAVQKPDDVPYYMGAQADTVLPDSAGKDTTAQGGGDGKPAPPVVPAEKKPATGDAVTEKPAVAAKKEESKSSGDIFSMFTDEETEENEISKFASQLQPVDIRALLREAEELKKYVRR